MVGAHVNVAKNLHFTTNKQENTQILDISKRYSNSYVGRCDCYFEPPDGGVGTYLSCSYLRKPGRGAEFEWDGTDGTAV